MPELPEVEVVRAGLEPAVTGARVSGVTVLDERSLRRHRGPAEDFVDRLTGRELSLPRRRGKFLWIPLVPEEVTPVPGPVSVIEPVEMTTTDDRVASRTTGTEVPSVPEVVEGALRNTAVASLPTGTAGRFSESSGTGGVGPGSATDATEASEALVVHLGMSGQVLLREPGVDDRQTRIRIDLEHPAHGALRLNFADQRIFGSMALDDLLPTGVPGDTVPSQVAHIARDPLDPLFSDTAFLAGLARRRTGVKRALLDQTLISGIGNIYADEALWAARIHYDQPTESLSRPRAKLLLAEVRAVLGKALAEGGTSFDAQYVNVNGASGYFSHSLNAYGRHGEPCARCGRPLVRDTFMNRGSHYCAFCQRKRVAGAVALRAPEG
jgi:formamidopyrimidine-DNA glycosylase